MQEAFPASHWAIFYSTAKTGTLDGWMVVCVYDAHTLAGKCLFIVEHFAFVKNNSHKVPLKGRSCVLSTFL